MKLKSESYKGKKIVFAYYNRSGEIWVSAEASYNLFGNGPTKKEAFEEIKREIDKKLNYIPRVPEQDFRNDDGDGDYDRAANWMYEKDYGRLTAEQQRKVEDEVNFSLEYYNNKQRMRGKNG